MDADLRDYFDEHLEGVLGVLPPRIHKLLDEVPLHVEDYPPQRVLDELGIRGTHELCGLYTGVPLSDRSVMHSPTIPDAVTIYRRGILKMSCDRYGNISEDELLRQIRITVLHELGHHHGLSESDLDELGYG